MKFSVKNKEEGLRVKEILRVLAEEFPYVTQGDVINAIGHIPAPEAHGLGWPSEHILDGKLQVRKINDTWFIYIFGDPMEIPDNKSDLSDIDVCVFPTELFEKLVDEIVKLRSSLNSGLADIMYAIDKNNNGFYYRNCIVKAAKSGPKEKRQDRPAIFHRWADLSKGVQQVVAIVEFGDGHVEQVQPDRVIFQEVE